MLEPSWARVARAISCANVVYFGLGVTVFLVVSILPSAHAARESRVLRLVMNRKRGAGFRRIDCNLYLTPLQTERITRMKALASSFNPATVSTKP